LSELALSCQTDDTVIQLLQAVRITAGCLFQLWNCHETDKLLCRDATLFCSNHSLSLAILMAIFQVDLG